MSAHAKLGPSACERWSTCTASVALIDDLKRTGTVPENTTSVYAAEGTVAHEVRQLCLEFDLSPHSFIGDVIEADGMQFTVDDAMAEALLPGLDWIREHTESPDVEIRLDLSPWLPEQFGTMDAGWLSVDGKTLFVSDLKFGMGEDVAVEANKQQMLYALGYWAFRGYPKVEKIVVHIDQPRLGGSKFWECTLADLVRFGDDMRQVYGKINSGNTEFVPSDKACRWCDARDPRPSKGYMGCAARNNQILDLFMGALDEVSDDEPTFTSPENITPERRYYIVKHAKAAEKWLAGLHSASLEAALHGTPDPGSKAVIGQRGNRFFKDADAAETILVDVVGDAAFKPKQLVGITEAEKLLKPGRQKRGNPEAWEALQELVDQPDGKPILVPESDARPAIVPLSVLLDDQDDEPDETDYL